VQVKADRDALPSFKEIIDGVYKHYCEQVKNVIDDIEIETLDLYL